MLLEIFQSICSELYTDLKSRSVDIERDDIVCGPGKPRGGGSGIRVELLRFGSDSQRKPYLPAGPSAKAFYSFTFFVIASHPNYESCISLTEFICDYFEKKPFMQVKIGAREYEMGISVLELSMDDINKFWIAQQHPHRPMLFLQARVSEI